MMLEVFGDEGTSGYYLQMLRARIFQTCMRQLTTNAMLFLRWRHFRMDEGDTPRLLAIHQDGGLFALADGKAMVGRLVSNFVGHEIQLLLREIKKRAV
jgi:hypothetical protein